MVDVTTEITIERPVAEVSAYAGDQANAPDWYENIDSVENLGGPAAEPGSKFRFVARFIGRELAYVYEIAELAPLRRLVMRTADGPFEMETTYEWEELPGGATGMSLRNRGNPSGFTRLLGPLMAVAIRRANHKDLRKLKAILESREARVTGTTG